MKNPAADQIALAKMGAHLAKGLGKTLLPFRTHRRRLVSLQALPPTFDPESRDELSSVGISRLGELAPCTREVEVDQAVVIKVEQIIV